jgi:Transposase DDE domain group 1
MLFADRTSCHEFQANQFRLLLSSFACVLFQRLRERHSANTDLEHAQVQTIRLKLLKVAASVVVSVRRFVFLIASSYPYQALFQRVARSLLLWPG